MTPHRNPDESEDPRSSTASASKPESEDGRWLPPTLDRLPTLTAIIASWSLVVSVAYDWGFLSALGISFAHAPTTLSDHLSSWLVWATLSYAPLPLVYVIYLMIRLRRYVSATLKEKDWVPSSVRPLFQRMRLAYRVAFWAFPAILLAWLLFGVPANPWGWLAISWIGLAGPLLIDLPNLLSKEEAASARSMVRSFNLPLILLIMVPASFFAFFGGGYGHLDRVRDDTMPKAFIRLPAGDSDEGPVVEEAYVLRSFANWLLVQDQDGTQVDWVRMERVERIEVPPNGRFVSLLCGVFGLWCRGDSGMTPTSSRLHGTDVEPHETTSAILTVPPGIQPDAVGSRTPLLQAPSRNSIPFNRACHSSSSTTSNRITLLRMAGTNSAQSVLRACSPQMSKTDRLYSVSSAAFR